jgi:hypothetical protein
LPSSVSVSVQAALSDDSRKASRLCLAFGPRRP